MLSSEEQKNNFILRLHLTTVNSGEYLIMPNPAKPAFLVPTVTTKTYRQALSLIKTISTTGELKKALLSIVPLSLIKRKFSTVSFRNPNESTRHSLILPWSQKICDKLTYISFDDKLKDIRVHKYAFTAYTKEMVRNEHHYLSTLTPPSNSKIKIPEVVEFADHTDYTYLVQSFTEGKHMQSVSSELNSFFSSLKTTEDKQPLKSHPYMMERSPIITDKLNATGNQELSFELKKLINNYEQEEFDLSIMHSDFSSSNTIHSSDGSFTIIDWEDACENGVNIDTEYFQFRKTLRQNKNWSITSASKFLAVFHYIYFMVKKENWSALKQMEIKNNVFSYHS